MASLQCIQEEHQQHQEHQEHHVQTHTSHEYEHRNSHGQDMLTQLCHTKANGQRTHHAQQAEIEQHHGSSGVACHAAKSGIKLKDKKEKKDKKDKKDTKDTKDKKEKKEKKEKKSECKKKDKGGHKKKKDSSCSDSD